MTYKITITPSAEKRLKKYDREIQKRFIKRIEKLKENPDSYGKPLRGILHGYWEVYFESKFRIIYTIDFENKIVRIEAIRHKDDF